jgi:hypothetical protein
MKNARPSKPVRRRRTMTGPTPCSLMARAAVSIRGDSRTSAVTASAMSLARFTTFCSSNRRPLHSDRGNQADRGQVLVPKNPSHDLFPSRKVLDRVLCLSASSGAVACLTWPFAMCVTMWRLSQYGRKGGKFQRSWKRRKGPLQCRCGQLTLSRTAAMGRFLRSRQPYSIEAIVSRVIRARA